MIIQIEQYRDKLFCDTIIISFSDRTHSFVQPKRTNNTQDQLFRGVRSVHRRTTGNIPMCKSLQSMFADTPLIKNLKNPDYMEVILSGKDSLVERFVEIDHNRIIDKMKDTRADESKGPGKIKQLIRKEESMSKLLFLLAS